MTPFTQWIENLWLHCQQWADLPIDLDFVWTGITEHGTDTEYCIDTECSKYILKKNDSYVQVLELLPVIMMYSFLKKQFYVFTLEKMCICIVILFILSFSFKI